MTKTVDAIVRGPQPYFGQDGVLYMPGQVVTGVPAEEVGKDAFRKIDVEVDLPNGNTRTDQVTKPVPFLPIDGASVVSGEVTAATVATGNPDRLNVTDFLKQGEDDIIAAIASGSVDDHLGVIEQQGIAGKNNRKNVQAAVAARLAAIHR